MEPREPAYTYQTKPLQMDGVTMAVPGRRGAGCLEGLPVGGRTGSYGRPSLLGAWERPWASPSPGWGMVAVEEGRKPHRGPACSSREKVSTNRLRRRAPGRRPFCPTTTRPQRARELLGPVAAAYRHYDNPAGARFKVGKRASRRSRPGERCTRQAPACSASAASWECARSPPCGTRPEPGDETPLVERSGARALMPIGEGRQGRRAGGRHHGGSEAPGDPLPRRPAQASPPLRRPHPHGQERRSCTTWSRTS